MMPAWATRIEEEPAKKSIEAPLVRRLSKESGRNNWKWVLSLGLVVMMSLIVYRYWPTGERSVSGEEVQEVQKDDPLQVIPEKEEKGWETDQLAKEESQVPKEEPFQSSPKNEKKREDEGSAGTENVKKKRQEPKKDGTRNASSEEEQKRKKPEEVREKPLKAGTEKTFKVGGIEIKMVWKECPDADPVPGDRTNKRSPWRLVGGSSKNVMGFSSRGCYNGGQIKGWVKINGFD